MSIEVLGIVVTIFTVIIGWAVVLGTCKQKIESNTKEIEEIKANYAEQLKTLKADFQKSIDEVKADAKEQSIILQSINNNIGDLNTKFDLFLNGQLKINGVNQ